MGTSVGDSESEAESLGENVRPNYNEQSPRPESESSSSDENNEVEPAYNYAKECQLDERQQEGEEEEEEEEEAEEESSENESNDESEEDFMKDRQTTEDYSAYRERIFDFTPKGNKEKKILVEEIKDEEAPSIRGINNTESIHEDETEEDTNKTSIHEQNEDSFKILRESISVISGVSTTNREDDSREDVREENESREVPENRKDEQMNTIVEDSQAENISEQIQEETKADIEELPYKTLLEELNSYKTRKSNDQDKNSEEIEDTLDNYQEMYGDTQEINYIKEDEKDNSEVNRKMQTMNIQALNILDTNKNKDVEENDNEIIEKDEQKEAAVEKIIDANRKSSEEILEDTNDKEYELENVQNEITLSDKELSDRDVIQLTLNQFKKSDLSLSSWTFDTFLDNFEREAEEAAAEANKSSSEDETSEEEETSNTSMTKNISSEQITKDKVQENKLEQVSTLEGKTVLQLMQQNVLKFANDSDDDDILLDEENILLQTVKMESTELNVISEKGDGPIKYDLVKIEKAEEFQESAFLSTDNKTLEATGLVEETVEDIQQVVNDSLNRTIKTPGRKDNNEPVELKTGKTKENVKALLTGWKKMTENLQNEASSSDSEESDDVSTDEEETPYYRKLDKSESTKLITTTEHSEEATCDSPKSVKSKEELIQELSIVKVKQEIDEKEDTSYREMLAWDLKVSNRTIQILSPREQEEAPTSEVVDLILKTNKENKAEFEIVPPRDIADEKDVIMYPRRRKPNIICNQNSSMYAIPGRNWDDVKPSENKKILRISPNYSVFQTHSTESIKYEIKTESHSSENSLAVCNKISDVRSQMAEFSKQLDEFKERSRLAREEVIKDYNEAVEKELKMVEEIMKSKEKSFEEMKARWATKYKRNRKPYDIDENVLRKHFEEMGIIMEEAYTEVNLETQFDKLEGKELDRKIFGLTDKADVEAERLHKLVDNISCAENTVDSKSTTIIQCEETVLIQEERKENNAGADDEDSIVVIDTDSYEEYLTTNEDEETEETILNNNFDINYSELANYIPEPEENNIEADVLEKSGESYEECLEKYSGLEVLEKTGESYEEYFTTNGEDSEEYDERTDVKYEEADNITVEKTPFSYGQLVSSLGNESLRDEDKGEKSEDDSFKACEDKDETRLEDDGDCSITDEKPVVKRNVTCSLEMQLAKKSD